MSQNQYYWYWSLIISIAKNSRISANGNKKRTRKTSTVTLYYSKRPETGYGYIKQGEPLPSGVFAIERFSWKPDLATAEQYISSGQYLPASGMFMFGKYHATKS